MIKIGSVKIDTKAILAPMAGCTDLAFRLTCREEGTKFCFYEMLDANSITRRRINASKIIKTIEADSPVAAQILGSDPELVLNAANILLGHVKTPILDINCACPARKVIRKKAGAYLLHDLSMLCRILKKVSSSVNIPVTVKLRVGFDRRDEEHIVRIAKSCQDNGAKAIFVHGRLATQLYSGGIDYGAIKLMKDSVDIPVIGSGNVFSPEAAKKMIDETGCDGVLVARGALGSPWLPADIERYLKTGKLPEAKDTAHKRKIVKKHIDYANTHMDIRQAMKVGFMRKILIWYTKGFPEAARIRANITSVKNYEELIPLIDTIF